MATQQLPRLESETRDRIGSRYAQRLRRDGRLPGVIYGHKADPVPVSVDHKEVITILEHGAHVLNVNLDGDQTQTCLVKDIQFGYLGDNVIHIDFARVDLDEEVTVHMSLHFTGEPKLLKSAGAVMPLSAQATDRVPERWKTCAMLTRSEPVARTSSTLGSQEMVNSGPLGSEPTSWGMTSGPPSTRILLSPLAM
jgi:ribosomal protein bL25 (Ctc-form)